MEGCWADIAATGSAESLWKRSALVPDRRGCKGRQHGLLAMVTLTLAAMLAGGNDLRAVFRWRRRLPPATLALLGLGRTLCHAMGVVA